RGHTGRVVWVAFCPDGRLLASLGKERDGDAKARVQLKLWDVAGRRELPALPESTGSLEDPAFSPDGKRLAASAGPGVRVWDLAARKLALTLRGHGDQAEGVAFSPDGKWLAAAGTDGTVKVWDAGSGRELANLRGHTGQVHAVAFGPAGAGREPLLA